MAAKTEKILLSFRIKPPNIITQDDYVALGLKA